MESGVRETGLVRQSLPFSGSAKLLWSTLSDYLEKHDMERTLSQRYTDDTALFNLPIAEARLKGVRQIFLGETDWQAKLRIARVYHAEADKDRNKEWEVRLGGSATPQMETERQRLVARCRQLESQAAGWTLAQLQSTDPTSDSTWAAPVETP